MSIRLRLAVVFAVASALLFALGSWLFAVELSSSLLGSVDSQLAVQLGQAGSYLRASGRPGPSAGSPAPGEYVIQVIDPSGRGPRGRAGARAAPVPRAAQGRRAAGGPSRREYVIQVIAPSGRVRGASADAGTALMLSASEVSQARRARILLTSYVDGERERLLAAPLPRHPGWVAVAGVSLEAVDGTLSDVTRELVIAGAVFVAAAGLGAHGLARAALSPVERMRREVAALSERDQAPRVQVPRTRDEIAAL